MSWWAVQVNRIMKSQGGLMAEDRRALLAEQQASMERLVSLISASINRDLPLRMEEIVRAEVSYIATQHYIVEYSSPMMSNEGS